MELSSSTRKRLNQGGAIPILGLGTWQARAGNQTRRTVSSALSCGYRLIDTAAIYGNEKEVGEAFRASISTLGLSYVDLYLIHWPVEGKRLDSWKALVTLKNEGLCKAIGVSNYTIADPEELLNAAPVVPAVNQVEFHPLLYQYQRGLLSFCEAHGIVVEAFSPLTRGKRLSDSRLAAIARKYGKSTAQLLLRWALQHEVAVIPKSVHPRRIRENAEVFDFAISAEDMKALDILGGTGHESGVATASA